MRRTKKIPAQKMKHLDKFRLNENDPYNEENWEEKDGDEEVKGKPWSMVPLYDGRNAPINVSNALDRIIRDLEVHNAHYFIEVIDPNNPNNYDEYGENYIIFSKYLRDNGFKGGVIMVDCTW